MKMDSSLILPPANQSAAVRLAGGAGAIEILLSSPKASPLGGVVVCHPHPLHGGAMANKVVYALASAALKSGFVALRFNFRGVGESEGAYDAGHGETDDTVLLGEALRARLPKGLPLVMAGFSFGAFVSLQAASRLGAAALMSVAPPFSKTRDIYKSEDGGLPAHPGCPWTVIHSRDDEVVAYEETAEVLARYDPPPRLVTVDGAGHFFHGRLEDVRTAFGALLDTIRPI